MYDTLRTLDDPADLARYLRLKAERKRLDAELKALEPTIYSALLDEDGSTFDTDGLTLSVRTRRTYEYSPAVDALAGELKALKTYEVKARIAACTKATGYVAVTKTPPAPPAKTARPPLRLAA
ncbi:hypothetical protein [Rubrivirga sp.]|uniref:hypothetical protein n=1 Tax=Rubrivirga sp. TaxID=1885344 RepID=UPI003B522ED4